MQLLLFWLAVPPVLLLAVADAEATEEAFEAAEEEDAKSLHIRWYLGEQAEKEVLSCDWRDIELLSQTSSSESVSEMSPWSYLKITTMFKLQFCRGYQ